MSGLKRWVILVMVTVAFSTAQTTQSTLLIRVIDSATGRAIPKAAITCEKFESDLRLPGETNSDGAYTYSALTPGRYLITAGAAQYQPQEIHEIDLPPAGRLELTFRLRLLNDVWEARRYQSYVAPGTLQTLMFYGPDLDTSRIASFEANHGTRANLDTSVSTVIDSETIRDLPLTGRDVYTVLILLPGVTADLATARGLGFSVHGQRPSSSNYLLDGLENNDLLITGPLGSIAPEAVQEYRISTSNFSAEYGRTTGFLANAVTRSGTDVVHGLLYGDFKNELLNANGFQENAHGYSRAPLREVEPGFVVSGPILRRRLFGSGSLDLLHFGSRNDPQPFALPTAAFISQSDPSSDGGSLLHRYPAAAVPQSEGNFGVVTIAPPVTLERAEALARVDYLPGSGRNRIFWRASISRTRMPDLVYNPYPAFFSPYHQAATSVAGGWTLQISPQMTNELRFGRTADSARYDRPHVEVPQISITSESAMNGTLAVDVPASQSSLSFRYVPHNWEAVDNWSWIRGRHFWKFGGGALWRTLDSAFTVDRDGWYSFQTLTDFVHDRADDVLVAYDRVASGYNPVPYNRHYRYTDFHLFAQDAFQASRRLSLNYGFRYDYFGAPVNTGITKDTLLRLGPGSNFDQQLGGLSYQTPTGGDQALFDSDRGDWAVRAGLSYDLTGRGGTLLRASYGIFYDRPFDNLWETVSLNRQVAWDWSFGAPVSFLDPVFSQLAVGAPAVFQSPFHQPVLFQQDLRNPRIQTAFLGVQERMGAVTLEANGVVSRSRRLWTTDAVNRDSSLAAVSGPGRPYPDPIGPINYRANQGESDYSALTITARYRSAGWNGQIAYTWSHSIDDQSDPLLGFGSYNVSREATAPDGEELALFTVQGVPRADRGNSDFDQRHNLVFYGAHQLTRGFLIAAVGAIRSGLPFTVFANNGNPNQRANLLDPAAAWLRPPAAIPGGELLLNANAFGQPDSDAPGNTGRNAFAGPGLISADVSVAKSLALPKLGESVHLVVRADFYNVMNHANLNNPQAFLGGGHFGQAPYGRQEKNPGFPILSPLNETARQVQLFLRLEF